MPTCNDCGREVDPEWNVCPDCGHDLAGQSADETDEGDGVPTASSVMTRRALGGSLVAGLAMGAAGLGAIRLLGNAEHRDAGEEGWEQRSVETTESGRVVRGEATLEPGTFVAEQFSVSAGARLGTRVVSIDGGAFDVYGVRAAQFENYREAAGVDFVTALTQSRIERARGMFGNPPEDDYYLILDNTAVYNAEPDGPVRVDVEMGVGDF